MINEKIVPISPYGFRFPSETEIAIDETLKLCGISGEDASMIAIEVMKKLGKSDEIPACCRGLAEEKRQDQNNETQLEKKLRGKSPEEQYRIVYWLMHVFGRAYTSSDNARIDWISGYIKDEPNV